MKRISFVIIAILICLTSSAQTIKSPGGNLTLHFSINPEGIPTYQLSYGKQFIVNESALGIEVYDQPSFINNFSVVKVDSSIVDESWNPVWGEVKTISNNYLFISR